MTDTSRRTRKTIVALAGGVLLVVAVAHVAVFARGDVTPLDPATPQGVVQQYSQAVIDGDVTTALTYLAPDIADSCERVRLASDDVRLTLLESTEREDTARVRVLVVTTYGLGPLGPDEYESEEAFDLVDVGGEWRIETAPWSLTVCAADGVPR